jgi:hypothetical protein
MQPITWSTLEFEPKERHPDWIWYAGFVAIIVAVLSFFYGNVFFGIFALIAGATVIIYAQRAPKTITITINDEGVSVNEELIQIKQITQFWLDETDKQDKLLLLVRGSFIPLVSLPIEGVTAETIRTKLTALKIPEVEMRESRSIKIFDRLGF